MMGETGCRLCPRACGVVRSTGELGFCKASSTVRAARAALHFWEEPCISGERGSGAVFFSHCTLKCEFCQNYDISHGEKGNDLTEQQLADIFIKLQEQGAHNINLVTPTQYALQVIDAVAIAKNLGMVIPVVYNCGGYETVETIKLLKDTVDVWLPDFKFFGEAIASRYLKVPDYPQRATEAIDQMLKQAGTPVLNHEGIVTSGVMVRHLLLPTLLADSMQVVRFLYERYGEDIIFSLMSQYTPMPQCRGDKVLSHHVNPRHYEALVDFAAELGITQCFIQQKDSVGEQFIPSFEGEGVL